MGSQCANNAHSHTAPHFTAQYGNPPLSNTSLPRRLKTSKERVIQPHKESRQTDKKNDVLNAASPAKSRGTTGGEVSAGWDSSTTRPLTFPTRRKSVPSKWFRSCTDDISQGSLSGLAPAGQRQLDEVVAATKASADHRSER
ncbi:hypothetical protein OPT61_g9594 [Boeremia exigua]|uniref:Uncharacterized protein n=1 Tax=Boeremia exigua TaxID=749465 RepID=A0ACC2HUX9_9PLEO|nr:hypothetical protein OPT61_g9594 [Boeremia exigua]